MKSIEVKEAKNSIENPKDLYNLIIYHLGIDQMIKEINNQCNEQGEVSLKFWKGYQNQIYEIISK